MSNLHVADNVIRGNGGSYGGGVRVGTPYENPNSTFASGSRNTGLLERNQIRDNGGTNLAGGVGIFGGSDGYQVTRNAICGNFSAEYGGAVTAFGYQGSTGGRISGNRVWFNGSYDEGGGVMVAGELPSTPTGLTHGTGPVSIDHNVISSNIANDDGGGIRVLQASGDRTTKANLGRITISNNTVVNNVSAHEGGGIALDDAVFVDVVHNTVARNLTTATAVTSDGTPAPAGLSTAGNSAPLQQHLVSAFPASTVAATAFSKPTILNDLFWDNRAGTYSGGTVTGIGMPAQRRRRDRGALGPGHDRRPGRAAHADRNRAPGGARHRRQRDLAGQQRGHRRPRAQGALRAVGRRAGLPHLPGVPAVRRDRRLLPANLMGDYHLAGTGSPAGQGGATTGVGGARHGRTYTVARATTSTADLRPGRRRLPAPTSCPCRVGAARPAAVHPAAADGPATHGGSRDRTTHPRVVPSAGAPSSPEASARSGAPRASRARPGRAAATGPAAGGDPGRHAPGRHRRLGVDAAGAPADPPFFPDSLAPAVWTPTSSASATSPG